MQTINFGFGSPALSYCFSSPLFGAFLPFLGLSGLFLDWVGAQKGFRNLSIQTINFNFGITTQNIFWDLLTQPNNFCFGSMWFLQLCHTFLGGWLDQLGIQPPQPPSKAGVWAGADLGKILNTSKKVQILIGVNFGYQQLTKNDQNFVLFDFSCPNNIKLLRNIQPIITTGFECFNGLFRITMHLIKIFILTAFLDYQI